MSGGGGFEKAKGITDLQCDTILYVIHSYQSWTEISLLLQHFVPNENIHPKSSINQSMDLSTNQSSNHKCFHHIFNCFRILCESSHLRSHRRREASNDAACFASRVIVALVIIFVFVFVIVVVVVVVVVNNAVCVVVFFSVSAVCLRTERERERERGVYLPTAKAPNS